LNLKLVIYIFFAENFCVFYSKNLKNGGKVKNFKKIAAGSFAALLTIPYARPVFAEKLGIVTASGLNMRSAPSASSKILCVIPKNSIVTVNSSQNDWLDVTFSGNDGFVFAKYVNVHEENLTSRKGSCAGERIAESAKKFLGTPYVWGGSTPKGFDCSGLVYYLYKQAGTTINRVASAQMKNGIHVDKNNLRPGDIIGFYGNKNKDVNHVGVYIGGGNMIHAKQTGSNVRTDSVINGTYARRFAEARRIFN
jgi:cell wall-associated NlpC family hydrolase